VTTTLGTDPFAEDSFDTAFFAAPEPRDSTSPVALDEPTHEDERRSRIFSPLAVERRRRFARVVLGVVGACGVVGSLAVVRGMLADPERATLTISTQLASAAEAPSPAARAVAPAVLAPPLSEPVAPLAMTTLVPSAVSVVMGATDAPSPAEVAPTLAVAPSSETASTPAIAPAAAVTPPTDPSAAAQRVASASAVTPESAAEARRGVAAAVEALQRGRVAAAIVAAARATELDPTDGEAWLVLGAAYEERGASADARRCYASCVSQGKRGPRAECAALLRRN